MKNGKLRVALVGVSFGAEFVPIYLKHPDVDSLVLVDTDRAQLDKIGDKFLLEERLTDFGAMLAVNLAVMNMLPIPALDGGKIFFLIIDEIAMKLFRKKIPEKYEMAVNTVGFVALMGFMLVVTFNDVFKLFG